MWICLCLDSHGNWSVCINTWGWLSSPAVPRVTGILTDPSSYRVVPLLHPAASHTHRGEPGATPVCSAGPNPRATPTSRPRGALHPTHLVSDIPPASSTYITALHPLICDLWSHSTFWHPFKCSCTAGAYGCKLTTQWSCSQHNINVSEMKQEGKHRLIFSYDESCLLSCDNTSLPG